MKKSSVLVGLFFFLLFLPVVFAGYDVQFNFSDYRSVFVADNASDCKVGSSLGLPLIDYDNLSYPYGGYQCTNYETGSNSTSLNLSDNNYFMSSMADGTYKMGMQRFVFNSSLLYNRSVYRFVWGYECKLSNIFGLDFNVFLWNFTGESWSEFVGDGSEVCSTSEALRLADVSSFVDDYLWNGTAYFLMYASKNTGADGIFYNDFLFVNVSYSGLADVGISYPVSGTVYDDDVVNLNFSVVLSNESGGCWYTLDNFVSNVSVNCSLNVSGLLSGEGSFNWSVFLNDSAGNVVASDTVSFVVGYSPPVVSLDFPLNDVYYNFSRDFPLNWTAVDPNGISECHVFHNDSGWGDNVTVTGVSSGVQAFYNFNFSDGNVTFNVWCNDTTHRGNFSGVNVSFVVDTVAPVISLISVSATAGSQTVSFTVPSFSELYCNNTFYSVHNESNEVENGLGNVSTSCGVMGDTFVVTHYGRFNLSFWMRDRAGNLNLSVQEFVVSQLVISPSSGGAGGGDLPEYRVPARNFSVYSLGFGDKLDLVLALGSVKPRSKGFFFVNEDVEPVRVRLFCLTENVTGDGDFCDFVSFENDSLVLSINEVENSFGRVFVSVPDNASFGDVFGFNILAVTDAVDGASEFVKLSVGVRVPFWGLVFKWSFVPLQDEPVRSYPVSLVALFVAFLVASVVFLLLRGFLPFTGLVLALLFFVLVFCLLVFLL